MGGVQSLGGVPQRGQELNFEKMIWDKQLKHEPRYSHGPSWASYGRKRNHKLVQARGPLLNCLQELLSEESVV